MTGVGTDDLGRLPGGAAGAPELLHQPWRGRHRAPQQRCARRPSADSRTPARSTGWRRSAELLPAEALALAGPPAVGDRTDGGRRTVWSWGCFRLPASRTRAASGTGRATGASPTASVRCWPTSVPISELPAAALHHRHRRLHDGDPAAGRRAPSLTAVPPTRFADNPAVLRAARVAAITAQGVARSLGVVDDMSGPFVLAPRHRLGRRLDAGALAELVVARRLTLEPLCWPRSSVAPAVAQSG